MAIESRRMPTQRGPLFQATFAFPMVSVCVLVGAFLVYYFPITAEREATLNRLAFRSLAALTDSISYRIVNYVDGFIQRAKRPGGDGCIDGVGVVVDVADVKGQHWLSLRCGKENENIPLAAVMEPYLRGMVDPLFDEILLTDASGAVLFQSARTASRFRSIRTASFRSASQQPDDGDGAGGDEQGKAQAPAFERASQASTLVTTEIAGEQYRLYVVPMAIEPGAAIEAAPPLVLVGMTNARRFRAESMAVPGTALISTILLVLVLIVAAWPLLKFATMGATERIRRRSAAYLFLSTLATIVLVCILAIHLRYTENLDTVDGSLARLAERIETNLAGELRVAVRVLDAATRKWIETDEARPAARSGACESSLSTARMVPAERLVPDVLTHAGLRVSDYPYFDRIFWSDSRGHQHVKWEAARPTTPTFVGDRVYYQETVANRLWRFAGPPMAFPRFRVDFVLSRNTGERRAVVSLAAPTVQLCNDVTLSVASMVTPLLSLIDPVMPPDYGFALLDADGTVQFHSTSTRNGTERFVDEVDDPGPLQAALFARQGALLTTEYYGADHRLFVTPLTTIEDSPWSLIVFHNLSDGSAQHLERILLFSILALTYLLGLAIVVLASRASHGPQEWMWPRRQKRGIYLHLMLTVLLIAAPLYRLVFALSSPLSVLSVSWLIPVLAFAIVLLKLKPVHREMPRMLLGAVAMVFLLIVWFEPESKGYVTSLCLFVLAALALLTNHTLSTWLGSFRRPSLANSYACLWAALLVLTALLPCVGFFRVAHDYHGNISTRRQQVRTLGALEQREARVAAALGERTLTTNPDRRDVARWLFVRRRLEETLDRYDLALTTGSGVLMSRATSVEQCDGGLPRYLRVLAALDPYAEATQARALTDGTSPQRAVWIWCREGLNRLRLTGRTVTGANADALRLPPTRALYKSVTKDPVFLFPELVSELPVLRAWWLPIPILVFAATTVLTFLWVRPTIRQMFLLDVRGVGALPEIALGDVPSHQENLILLTTDRVAAMAALRQHAVCVIDCGDLATAVPAGGADDAQAVVVLDRFDDHLHDAAANEKKLELLERLTSQRPEKRIVIVTTVDPVFFFGPDSHVSDRWSREAHAASHAMERWAAVLAHFRRRRVADEPPGDALERARQLWATCTTTERVSLYQLAHDGWVNPNNEAALQQLEQRGVIAGRPYGFVDPVLRSFVSKRIGRHDRRVWERESTRVWDGIRLMLVVVIFAVLAAALFFSQQGVLGLIATGVGVLTPLTKLLSEAHSFRSLLGFGQPKA
jgi:hypothetical protein